MDRKARLKALAAKAGRLNKSTEEGADSSSNVEDAQQEASSSKPEITFRNYSKPEDVADTAAEPSSKRPKTREEEEPSLLDQALAKAEKEVKNKKNVAGTVEVQPKINWDLKRDIAPSIEKLERRTQRALVQLLKERLEREAGEEAGDLD